MRASGGLRNIRRHASVRADTCASGGLRNIRRHASMRAVICARGGIGRHASLRS